MIRDTFWIGPDGKRYCVTVAPDFDLTMQALIFRRDDGWIGYALIPVAISLDPIIEEDMQQRLHEAHGGEAR